MRTNRIVYAPNIENDMKAHTLHTIAKDLMTPNGIALKILHSKPLKTSNCILVPMKIFCMITKPIEQPLAPFNTIIMDEGTSLLFG